MPALFVKTKILLIFIVSLLGLFLTNISLSHAKEIVLLKLECGASPNGQNKAYETDLAGIIDGRSIAIAHAWKSEYHKQWMFGSMIGQVKNQHLEIKGDVSWEKKQGGFPLFFRSRSYGNILDDLKKGIRGFEGQGDNKANCSLKYQDSNRLGNALASVSTEKNYKKKQGIYKINWPNKRILKNLKARKRLPNLRLQSLI